MFQTCKVLQYCEHLNEKDFFQSSECLAHCGWWSVGAMGCFQSLSESQDAHFGSSSLNCSLKWEARDSENQSEINSIKDQDYVQYEWSMKNIKRSNREYQVDKDPGLILTECVRGIVKNGAKTFSPWNKGTIQETISTHLDPNECQCRF